MAGLTRTGVSLEQDLLKDFDWLISKRGYKTRSEAIRDLIRESLVSEAIDKNEPVVATCHSFTTIICRSCPRS